MQEKNKNVFTLNTQNLYAHISQSYIIILLLYRGVSKTLKLKIHLFRFCFIFYFT